MRLEINIPDSTHADVKNQLAHLIQRLSDRPELVEEIRFDNDLEDAEIQRMFTPELLAEIEAADADIDAGNFVTADQLDEHFKRKTDAWVLKNQY